MSGLLFVSQSILDAWAGQGRIELEGNAMKLLGGDGKGRGYALEPAVRFLRVEGGAADPHALLHKVKSAAQLRELGAEHLEASVLLGEVAYAVEPGFLAEAAALHAAAAAPAARSGAAPQGTRPAPAGSFAAGRAPDELDAKRKEAEALARFLLENLS